MHKFIHSFQNTLNLLCSSGLNIETTSHYFLHCLLFHADDLLFWTVLTKLIILNKCESVVTCILLYGNDFVLSTNRFDEPLYVLWIHRCVSFYSWLYGYNVIIFKILIFTFSSYFFYISGTHDSHGARLLLFLCLLCKCSLNGIKVWVFFEKNIEKKLLCHHDKNYCYFCKSSIPVINLIVGFRNMIKLSKNMSL